MTYQEEFQDNFNKMVRQVADTLEDIKGTGFYEFENEDDEEGTYYFDDIYNTDFIWRMGYGLMGVRIMVACGGPNIWVDTFEKTVHGYWGGDEAIAYLTNDCCERIEDEFDDYTVREMIYNDGDRAANHS